MMIDAAYALGLLNKAVAARNDPKTGVGGQVAVGNELGCTSSLICQLQGVTYTSPDKWYRLIIERYGNVTVQCPSLGEISLIRCTEEWEQPSGIAPSAAYVRQRQTCKKCERRQ